MTNEARGAEIKRRRLDLGIDGIRQFAKATGRDRGTLVRAEEGEASAATLDWLEAWLTRQEEENGVPAEPGSSPIRVTFHDVTTSSIGEIIVEGPPPHAEELRTMVRGLLADLLKGEDA